MLITTSGVNSDKALFTSLSYGPNYLTSTDQVLSYWPEVIPGYFTAGTTIHGDSDYLFAREQRAVTPQVNNFNTLDIELPKQTGPILASWCPTGVSGDIYSTSVCATGWVSRDTNFKELCYSVCRQRLLHSVSSMGGWTLVLSSGFYNIYKVDVPGETLGFGPIHLPRIFDVRDPSDQWMDYRYVQDLLDYGQVNTKQWAASGSSVYIKSTTPPSNLYISWISGQASLDQEEFAYTTDTGVSLKLPCKDNITNIEVQQLSNFTSPTGAAISTVTTLPRQVLFSSVTRDIPVVVRYRPFSVYGTTVGVSGAVVAFNLSSPGVVCFRYEAGSRQELHSPGLYTADKCVLSSSGTLPGFFLGVVKDHPLHSTIQNSILGNGQVPSGSKVLGWASPTTLFDNTSPSTVRVLVLGPDDLPIPRTIVGIINNPFLSTPSSVKTNLNGEAFFEVSKIGTFIGEQVLTLTISVSGTVYDSFPLTFSMMSTGSISSVSAYSAGTVVVYPSTELARSAISNRQQFYMTRILADGTPSPYSNLPVTVSCKNGVLYNPYNNNTLPVSNSGGQSITFQRNSGNNSSFDEPMYFEYKNTSVYTRDVITIVWESPIGEQKSYGYYVLGDL